jgi:hypothetical protein
MQTIAHDKGKPVVKQGRKAVSLFLDVNTGVWRDCLVAEGDRRRWEPLSFFEVLTI